MKKSQQKISVLEYVDELEVPFEEPVQHNFQLLDGFHTAASSVPSKTEYPGHGEPINELEQED